MPGLIPSVSFPLRQPPFAPAPAGAQTEVGCVAGTGQSGGGFTRSLLEWELTQASARRKGRQRCGTRISPIRARPIRRRARTEQYAHLVGAAYDLLRVCRSKPRWPGRDRARRRETRIGLPIRMQIPSRAARTDGNPHECRACVESSPYKRKCFNSLLRLQT